MFLLAGIALLLFAPTMLLMMQGAVELVSMIYHLFRALYFLVADASVQRMEPEPAAPKRSTRKTPKGTAPIDPDLAKIRGMAKTWKGRGQRVGLVNLETGELFEPADLSEIGG